MKSSLVLLMSVAAGSASANVWANQSMLPAIAHGLGITDQAVSVVPAATQFGFAAGILLLVPLGDILDRKRLILAQLSLLVLALTGAALARTLPQLAIFSVFVGAGGATGQQIVTYSADLSPAEVRGATVGKVLGGLLMGILLGRVVSGSVSEHFGWRAMFALGAAWVILFLVLLAIALPAGQSNRRMGWPQLMLSLAALVRDYPALRRASVIQALLFAAFTAFWSILAIHIAAPPLSRGGDVAGLFGLAGAAGILAAPLAGRIADSGGPQTIVRAGIFVTLGAFVLLVAWLGLAGLAVGTILLDLGVQAAQTANIAVIYGLQEDARGRMNTIFMSTMFLGGALGAVGAGFAWSAAGWTGVCAFGGALVLAALVLHHATGGNAKAGIAPVTPG